MERNQEKYVDDMTMAESINLKESLVTEPDHFDRPVPYHSRFLQKIRPEKMTLSEELQKLHKYTIEHDMMINLGKTKKMLFNPCVSYDFTP